jgi:pyruvate formate lyase activating enzyme
MDRRFVREALLQEKVNGKIRCNACQRRCTLGPCGYGRCRTRQNTHGQLVTRIYGQVSALAADPIEKKPFYHFHPGTRTLTMGSWSCNFGCPWCQNWAIARTAPPKQGRYISPERFVKLAERVGCRGVSVSYNEPTLSLEWSLDIFRLARAGGLYTTYVTNGYLTPEALDLLREAGLDAMNIDIKGGAEGVKRFCKGVDVEKVWDLASRAHTHGVHVEITTLVIPTVNDTEPILRSIVERIVSDLGPDVPWHVTGYYPAYRFTAPPTPLVTLEDARRLGRDAGLNFVYLGNVRGRGYGDTECPVCGARLIHRLGFEVLRNWMRNGRCPQCSKPIAGVWNS